MHKYDEMTEMELRAHFNEVARELTARLPEATGFMLIVAPFGSHGVAQYVGNVHRSCAMEWMAETIERWKNKEHIPR